MGFRHLFRRELLRRGGQGIFSRREVEDADGVRDALFHGELAVGVHFALVFLAVSEASGAADAPVHARHALYEVGVQHALRSAQERGAASLYTVAGDGSILEVGFALFFERLCHRVRYAAAPCEYPAEIGRVVQHAFRKLFQLYIARIEEGLQFLEGDDGVYIRAHFRLLEFHFLRGAGTYEHDLAGGGRALDVLGYGRGRGEICGDVGRDVRELLLYVIHERRAAGGGEEPLFFEFRRFLIRHHIRAERGFHHAEKAEFAYARHHLPQFGVNELAGHRGRDDRIHLVFGVVRALFDHVDDVQDIALVDYRPERTLINARAARDALVVVYARRLVLVHGDGFHLAGVFAGTATGHYRGVGADLRALTALHAQVFVDVRLLLVVEGYGVAFANVLAAVRKAAAAGVGHFVAAGRAVVARDVDDLYDVGIAAVAAHGEFDALGNDGALLIHAAAHGGSVARDDGLGDVGYLVQQVAVPRAARHFAQHFVLEILNFCVEFSAFLDVVHIPFYSRITPLRAFYCLILNV